MSVSEPPLKKALAGLIPDLCQKHENERSPLSRLLLAWHVAAGPYIARHARPIALRDDELCIEADTLSLKVEIARLESELLGRLETMTAVKLTSIRTLVLTPKTLSPASQPPTPTPADTSLPEDDLPPVREELRPIVHRLWRLHRRHRSR